MKLFILFALLFLISTIQGVDDDGLPTSYIRCLTALVIAANRVSQQSEHSNEFFDLEECRSIRKCIAQHAFLSETDFQKKMLKNAESFIAICDNEKFMKGEFPPCAKAVKQNNSTCPDKELGWDLTDTSSGSFCSFLAVKEDSCLKKELVKECGEEMWTKLLKAHFAIFSPLCNRSE